MQHGEGGSVSPDHVETTCSRWCAGAPLILILVLNWDFWVSSGIVGSLGVVGESLITLARWC